MRVRVDCSEVTCTDGQLSSDGNHVQRTEHLESQYEHDTMPQRIDRVREDLTDIEKFYNVKISQQRYTRLRKYCEEQLTLLRSLPFESYDQEERIDYLLLQNHLNRRMRQLDLDRAMDQKTEPVLPFAPLIISLYSDRQNIKQIVGDRVALAVNQIKKEVLETMEKVKDGKFQMHKSIAFRAARTVDQLRSHLDEWFDFYNGYDPLFSWWVSEPYSKVKEGLGRLSTTIREKLVGIVADDEDAIVGEPIGRDGLLSDLKAELIPYTPEELIKIGETEYAWCEGEMKKYSKELGCKDDWRKAVEDVKNDFVDPGNQPQLINDLASEAIDYVKSNDLVTVPLICEEAWRMFMLTPEKQKTAPFLLGGPSIYVSYPTDTMDHETKMMSMRANNFHFSRCVVLHEVIPGHHLQFHMMARYRQYRNVFMTPFWVEGWAHYWEMVFWDKDFPKSPKNRIGMLFWRMHRCARIVFSLKFHLGEWDAQECIKYLIDKVGQEPATAEGEVRRSLNGDWSPLYQAAYMLGALQLYSLRQELVEQGNWKEKQFHDRILREGPIPIELLRALMSNQPLTSDFESSWRFYSGR